MKQIIISSLYLILLFCLSTFVFDPAYLYYEVWWLDIPMHILGGFGVAFLVNAVLLYKGERVSFMKIFLSYVVITLLWEAYEHTHNYMLMGLWNGLRSPLEDVLDTLKDVLNGFIGVGVAYLFIRK